MSDEKRKQESVDGSVVFSPNSKRSPGRIRTGWFTETVTVAVVSVILGIIIATLDMVLQYGINFLV